MLVRPLPTLLYTAVEARALDNYTIEALQVPALTLMTRAGEAALGCLQQNWRSARSIVLVCGAGNNAGDAYVLARLLHQKGYQVAVIEVFPAAKKSDAAQNCFQVMKGAGVVPTENYACLTQADVVVDAVFGVGLNRNVGGEYAAAIEQINQSNKPVLSLDIPSGLNASTGQVMGSAVRASATISFMTAKIGLFTGAGPDQSGQIFVDDLDTPSVAYQNVAASAQTLTHKKVRDLLPARLRSGHKGTHGHVLVLGGAEGYRGALLLAAEAAARAGAGLVTMLGYASGPELINVERPELMYRGIANVHEMREFTGRAKAVAIGPGLGTDESAIARFAAILETDLPLVVDADALRLLAAEPHKRDNWVLTPHPGEAALLMDTTVEDIQSDRLTAAQNIVERYGGTVILKGVGSIIVTGFGNEVLLHGNPGMGSGGMGDVLTGVIVGLLAQGLSIEQATRVGACVHARAGDRAAKSGERGLLARDLMPHIRSLVN